jgi:heme-degrading monooxygenase HmoA
MFASVSTWQVVPGALDRLLTMAPQIEHGLRQQQGFQSISVYANRAENTLLIISHWARREDLEADKVHHAQILQSLASVVTELQSEIYEVTNPSL